MIVGDESAAMGRRRDARVLENCEFVCHLGNLIGGPELDALGRPRRASNHVSHHQFATENIIYHQVVSDSRNWPAEKMNVKDTGVMSWHIKISGFNLAGLIGLGYDLTSSVRKLCFIDRRMSTHFNSALRNCCK